LNLWQDLLETVSADDGLLISSMSSASSTHVFFLLDWVLMEPAELLMAFFFLW